MEEPRAREKNINKDGKGPLLFIFWVVFVKRPSKKHKKNVARGRGDMEGSTNYSVYTRFFHKKNPPPHLYCNFSRGVETG